MTFVFKGELSRTDKFEEKDGGSSERTVAWAMGPKVYVGCNPHNALIAVNPASEWYRQFGYDFHYDSFGRYNPNYSLATSIQDLIDGPCEMSVELDGNLLKIVAEIRERDYKSTLWLDKEKGFRPVFMELKLREGYLERKRFSWKQYDGFWYLNSGEEATWTWEDGAKQPTDPNSKREVVIKKFSPNVDVGDSEFTLDGLNIPQGMVVADRVTGVDYRYGSKAN